MHCFPLATPAGFGYCDWRVIISPHYGSSTFSPLLVCHILIMESELWNEWQDDVPWPRQRPEARKCYARDVCSVWCIYCTVSLIPDVILLMLHPPSKVHTSRKYACNVSSQGIEFFIGDFLARAAKTPSSSTENIQQQPTG